MGRGIFVTLPSRWRAPLRSLQARAARWLASASYGRKWLVLGALIGIIAGLGAVVFYEALRAATHLFLGVIAGYTVPTPVGEGGRAASAHFTRPWAIPLVACVGALAGAILVFGIAPEAEGHGTDAAIAAVHHNPRGIRLRTVAVKIVASALTIGSGGSGGREGPTGQISAGFGSFLARLFDLSPADARIAVASGIGSGIGSIFGAPLGGAVLATEIMYRDDFEVEALLPSFIASIVGYVVFGSIEGFSPLFGNVESYRLTDARQLLWFGLIGILGGLIGLLYAKGFYGIADLFGRLPIPRWVRPALGGLIVGCIALAIPRGARHRLRMDTGGPRATASAHPALDRAPLAIRPHRDDRALHRLGRLRGHLRPGHGDRCVHRRCRLAPVRADRAEPRPRPGAVRHRRDDVVLREHLPGAARRHVDGRRDDGDAHPHRAGDGGRWARHPDRATQRRHHLPEPAAEPIRVPCASHPDRSPVARRRSASQAMAVPRCVVPSSADVATARSMLEASGVEAAPFVDAEGRYVGVVTLEALRRASAEPDAPALASLVDTSFLPIHQGVHLDVVLDTLTSTPQTWVAVVDDERRVIGTIATSDLIASYRRSLQASLRRVSEVSESSGMLDVVVAEDSPIVGASLRAAAIPKVCSSPPSNVAAR